MSNTVVTHQSWGSRLGNSFKGILFGLILFVVSFPLLFWNEGRTVHRARALAEGESACVESGETPDILLDGKLVHLTAEAVSDETLADDLFGVSVPGIRLRREVEMYQWEEDSKSTTKKNLGGSTDTTTTYSYRKGWQDTAVDSSSFHEPAGHENPAMPFGDETMEASAVRAGGFELAPSLISRIGGEQPLSLGGEDRPFRVPFPAQTAVLGGILYIRPGEAAPAAQPAPADGVTNAAPPAVAPAPDFAGAPRIGDLRVSFRHVPNHTVSIVAKQTGTRLGPYTTKNGAVELLSDGERTAEEMFTSAKSANKMFAWLLRLVGFLVMLSGVRMVLGPLETLADVVPFIGRIVGFGTGIVAALVAVPCTLVTIAIAWFAYRPVLGISLLVAAVAAVVLIGRRGRRAS